MPEFEPQEEGRQSSLYCRLGNQEEEVALWHSCTPRSFSSKIKHRFALVYRRPLPLLSPLLALFSYNEDVCILRLTPTIVPMLGPVKVPSVKHEAIERADCCWLITVFFSSIPAPSGLRPSVHSFLILPRYLAFNACMIHSTMSRWLGSLPNMVLFAHTRYKACVYTTSEIKAQWGRK